ncbi:MAG: isocitrate dehydrogenase (NADP(+)) [Candidatus Aureabacteria bacterium]|nr:isocitrate dehydrogenase (NADP(+)) [Candidatus Auribacterota bacterium]
MAEKITVIGNKLAVPDNPFIAFIEGDGTGPDIWKATRFVIDETVAKLYSGGRKIEWVEVLAGEKAYKKTGEWLPEETLRKIKEYIVAIKGPLTTPVGGGIRSLNVSLRQKLDLFACVRPVRHYKGVPSPVKEPDKINMVIFRENTEDVYAGIEWQEGSQEAKKVIDFLKAQLGSSIREDSGIGIKPMSEFCSKRIVKKAIEHALKNGFKSVTMMHKGNIQKFTEGAFRKWGYELAKEDFPDCVISEDELWEKHGGKQPEGKIVLKDRIADIMFQLVLLRPSEFGVIVTPNLNGDYLSDAVAAQVGGIGMAPGANMGDFVAIFEATHGTAPKYANQDKVNPGSLLLSACMMLEYIGWSEASESIKKAMEKTISSGKVTYDLARQLKNSVELKTTRFAEEIVRNLDS